MPLHVFLLWLMFFFSGATSLVYETLWVRILSLGVGSTSTSLSMVLSIFFFGLSLGSYWAGKLSHKVSRPVYYYGMMEGLSGVLALVILFPLLHFQSLLGFITFGHSIGFWGTLTKFFLVFLFLILPTLCMGATLPLLVKIYSEKSQELGKSISRLYAINTFGAVMGAVLTSFVLIPQWGVVKATYITVVVSLLVWFVAFFVDKAWGSLPVYPEIKSNLKKFFLKNWSDRIVFWSAGAIGFSSILAQVVWNKYLGIFFGTNIFGLGIILALFLTGIALGALILSTFIEKVENKKRLFYVLLLCSALGLFTTSYLLNWAPVMSNVIAYYLIDYISLLSIKIILTVLFLFPSTLLFGALLPLAIRILSDTAQEAPYITGLAYSFNTIGAILGAYLAGIILIPSIGSSLTIKIGLFTLLFSTLLLGLSLFKNKFKWWAGAIVGVLTVGLLGAATINFKNIIKSAYVQNIKPGLSLGEVLKYFSKDHEEFQLIHEGKTALISLSHDPNDGEFYKDFFRLKTNGLNESIYDSKQPHVIPKYEGLLGFLPYFFSRDPDSAFVVGYGGGYTVDFLTQSDLQKVHVVELEEGIIKASQVFYQDQNPILKRKNLKLEIEDARFTLSARDEKYDIIVSQPSHSWLSGVANLFTQDFFKIVQSRLTEKGVFAQWLNLYNINPTVIKSIFKTFYEVFPHGYVFTNYNDDEMILIGSLEPIEFQMQKLQQLSKDGVFKEILQQIHLEEPSYFLTHYLMSREKALEISSQSIVNTDINAYAEVLQSKLFYTSSLQDEVQSFLSQNFSPDLFQYVDLQKNQEEAFYRSLMVAYYNLYKFDKYYGYLNEIETKHGEMKALLGYVCLLGERGSCAEKNLMESWRKSNQREVIIQLLQLYHDREEYQKILDLPLENQWKKDNEVACFLHSSEYFLNKRSLSSSQKDIKNCGSFIWKALAQVQYQRNHLDLALNHLNQYEEQFSLDSKYKKMQLSLKSLLGHESMYQGWLDFYEYKTQEEDRVKSQMEYFSQHGWGEDVQTLQKHLEKLQSL